MHWSLFKVSMRRWSMNVQCSVTAGTQKPYLFPALFQEKICIKNNPRDGRNQARGHKNLSKILSLLNYERCDKGNQLFSDSQVHVQNSGTENFGHPNSIWHPTFRIQLKITCCLPESRQAHKACRVDVKINSGRMRNA